jgi:hypothetical protein
MINSVRNTVLSVLNKNNYGYISPSDFNLYAKQAQLEIFEGYFSDYNKTILMENIRKSGSDYADIAKSIAEAMELFLTSNFLIKANGNSYYAPSLTTTGDDFYLINRIAAYNTLLLSGSNTSVSVSQLVDSSADFVLAGVSVGDIVSNASTNQVATVTNVVNSTTLDLSSDIFTIIATDYFIYDASEYKEVEKVSSGKILMLNTSILTSPSTLFPAYVHEGSLMKVYPQSISNPGQIQAVYFRYPKDPKWTYITLASGEPIFDQSQPDYQDFEVPLEDEYKLIMKILQYCGMSIREISVAQFGSAQETQQKQQ